MRSLPHPFSRPVPRHWSRDQRPVRGCRPCSAKDQLNGASSPSADRHQGGARLLRAESPHQRNRRTAARSARHGRRPRSSAHTHAALWRLRPPPRSQWLQLRPVRALDRVQHLDAARRRALHRQALAACQWHRDAPRWRRLLLWRELGRCPHGRPLRLPPGARRLEPSRHRGPAPAASPRARGRRLRAAAVALWRRHRRRLPRRPLGLRARAGAVAEAHAGRDAADGAQGARHGGGEQVHLRLGRLRLALLRRVGARARHPLDAVECAQHLSRHAAGCTLRACDGTQSAHAAALSCRCLLSRADADHLRSRAVPRP